MFPIYLLTLGLSSGVAGAYIHTIVAHAGYALGMRGQLYLTLGGAAAYAATQLVFICILTGAKPFRGRSVYLMESFSHTAVLFLLPCILPMNIPWPHPLIEKSAPFVCVGLFVALHMFLKLLSFFAALQSETGRRVWAFAWLGGAVACVLAAQFSMTRWLDALEAALPMAPETITICRAGPEYAKARVMPEGSVVEYPLDPAMERCLTLRFSSPPDVENPVTKAWLTVTFRGETKRRLNLVVPMNESGWTTVNIAPDQFPAETTRCSIMWTAQEEPKWRRATGIPPIFQANRALLLSGPYEHGALVDSTAPNIVLIAIEGLGMPHMSREGYSRPTTPNLDRLMGSSMLFEQCFTPSPDALAASMSLMTGLSPLTHGFLGQHAGPLQPGRQTLAETLAARQYATAAFTEGDAARDLIHGGGFERGFEVFDASSPLPGTPPPPNLPGAGPAAESEPHGSGATLARARAWIADQTPARFFVFARLRELRGLELCAYYGEHFSSPDGKTTPRDIFDTALVYLDKEIGSFLSFIEEKGLKKSTVVIVTSLYGFDFSGEAGQYPRVGLSEQSLRVPTALYAPWLGRSTRKDVISLEDIPASLAKIAGAGFPEAVEGQEVLSGPHATPAVSVFGVPMVMSMRDNRWRLFWNTGRAPFRGEPLQSPEAARIYDVNVSRRAGWKYDQAPLQKELVTRWRDQLVNRLDRYDALWLEPAK